MASYLMWTDMKLTVAFHNSVNASKNTNVFNYKSKNFSKQFVSFTQ